MTERNEQEEQRLKIIAERNREAIENFLRSNPDGRLIPKEGFQKYPSPQLRG